MPRYKKVDIAKTFGVARGSKTWHIMDSSLRHPTKTADQIVAVLANKGVDTTPAYVSNTKQRMRKEKVDLPIVNSPKEPTNVKIRKVILANLDLGAVTIDKLLREKRISASIAKINGVRKRVLRELEAENQTVPRARPFPKKRKSRALTKREANFLPEGTRIIDLVVKTTGPLIPWENIEDYRQDFRSFALDYLPLWIKNWLSYVPKKGKKKIAFRSYLSTKLSFARRTYAEEKMRQDLAINSTESKLLQRILSLRGKMKTISQTASELTIPEARARELLKIYNTHLSTITEREIPERF